VVNVSRLYCGLSTPGDRLRYAHRHRQHPPRPVVVWNITKRCNLRCLHCYSDSDSNPAADELTTRECYRVIDDLADFGVPALLISGGEPLLRPDLFDIAAYAAAKGLKLTLSTNGTLITQQVASKIRQAGFNYVGISLDGIGQVNDRFRGKEGAFLKALEGIRNCKAVGQRVGLRMTLTAGNVDQLPAIFDFIEQEDIQRACFYHLVYAGRGNDIRDLDLTRTLTRKAVEYICNRTAQMIGAGRTVEVLTVDNHADGPYIFLKLQREGSPAAERVRSLLVSNGGALSSSGVGLANIDFSGNVHPDQFWHHYSLGNVRHRPFSEIWQDESDPLLYGLRRRQEKVHGRCRQCRFWNMCGGGLRVRADLLFGDPWAPDPACYLTDEEVLPTSG